MSNNNRIALLCDALRDEALIIKRSAERSELIGDDPNISFVARKIGFDSVSHAMELVVELSKIFSGETDQEAEDKAPTST